MSRPILHITLAQINPCVGALDENLARVIKAWDEAAEADLIVFPELVITGYPPEDLVLKPSFIDAVERVVELAVTESKNRAAAIFLTAPTRIKGKIYNAGHLIHGGAIIQTICKHNLPNYGVFDERRIFCRGELPAPVEFKDHTLGFMICEDMWFPEAAKQLKDQGAEMLIVPNGSPYSRGKTEERHSHARARIKETGLPLLYINQVGGQDDLVFDGGSFVMNEGGTVIAQASYFHEDLHATTWEKNDNGHWLCISDHDIHQPNEMASIYSACMLGLRDYVIKNKFPGVLIGMSGGIDSALSAALAVDALGPEMVRCVMMPSPYTSQDSLDDAAACSEALGVHYEIRSIEPAMGAFEEIMPGLSGLAHENMQSRARGLILMSLSNTLGHMVLTTGNKSEMAVGYATLYGDMCGGFNALKDLYKTQVFDLAKWRNSHKPAGGFGPSGVVIPERIITKPPTAELRPDQKDEDSLPPYEVLDGILNELIEHDLSVEDIVARGYDRDTVLKTWKLLDRAEYKRRQSAPGVKINARAFGRDRRYPITNLFNIMIEQS